MSESECATLAESLKAEITIPCHYGMFASHHGDVGRFYEIMKEKDLDIWFNNLELKQLERMFVWPYGADANDFIDYCDICWGCYTKEEKEGFYWRHSDDS